jgi:DNA-directed RNA polymerase I, II, and III subunit RPABC1
MAALTDKDKAYRLWRMTNTCRKMCHDRDYQVPTPVEYNYEDWLETFTKREAGALFPTRADIVFMFQHKHAETGRMYVFFSEESAKGLGSDEIKKFHKRMTDGSCYHAIIVFANKVVPQVKDHIIKYKQQTPPLFFELFNESELIANITEHMLVPHHRVLNDEEKTALLKRYKLLETQLPRVQVVDPISRYYGAQVGQVFKITRRSETAGSYITYRIVYDK